MLQRLHTWLRPSPWTISLSVATRVIGEEDGKIYAPFPVYQACYVSFLIYHDVFSIRILVHYVALLFRFVERCITVDNLPYPPIDQHRRLRTNLATIARFDFPDDVVDMVPPFVS